MKKIVILGCENSHADKFLNLIKNTPDYPDIEVIGVYSDERAAAEKLGVERTKHCHIHFSKIEFGAKGEIRHLNYDDNVYGPEFDPLAKALKILDLKPIVICESKTMMAEDAYTLKNIYEKTPKI